MLFRDFLPRNDAIHFLSCSDLLCEGKSIDFSSFFEKIGDINISLMIDLLRAEVKLFNNPKEVNY